VSHAVAAVLASALAAAMVLVQPWAGRRRYRRLLDRVTTEPDARLRHYLRGIGGEWVASAIIVLVGVAAGRSAASIGLAAGTHPGANTALIAEVAVVLAISAVVFRFGGAGVRAALRRQARGFAALLPHDRRERWAFAGLAVTAGICEEFVFRGFGVAYLRWLWPAAPRPAMIVIVGAAFGLAHLYQGGRGIVLTGLVGGYLTWLVLATGSLVPAMIIHALLDLRVLALPDLDEPAGAAVGPPSDASQRMLVQPPDL
jgi:hypothetical protein